MKQIKLVNTTPTVMRGLYDLVGNGSDNTEAFQELQLSTASGKDMLHQIAAGMHQPHAPYLLSRTTAQQVIERILSREKIPAIKELRDETGERLAHAKKMVEEFEATIQHAVPLFPHPMITPTMLTVPQEGSEQVRELKERLQDARLRAGNESYRKLSDRLNTIGCYTSPTSVHRAMTGSTVPPWDIVVALLRVFRVPSEDVRETWHQLWSRARVQQLGADYPDDNHADNHEDSPNSSKSKEPHPPPGHECDSCGAWVVNLERHHAWHWRVEGSPTTANALRQVSGA